MLNYMYSIITEYDAYMIIDDSIFDSIYRRLIYVVSFFDVLFRILIPGLI